MAEKDFKLLAIRALKECSPKYSKILEPDKFYQFYSDYEFEVDEDGFLTKITCSAKVPSIYSLMQNDGPSINVSAIVGKNGSGKSTLFDLLYQFCFYLSMSMDLLKPELYDKEWNEIKKSYEEMKLKDGLSVEVIFKVDDKIISYVNKREKKQNDTNPEWPLIDVFFWSDGDVFKKNEKWEDEYLNESNKSLDSYSLGNFFYSVAINYSLYGLNTNEIGMWPYALFHKNDGYQTPIVLNPYRENGNINVNSEADLAKYRLLANKMYEYLQRKRDNEANQIGMIYDYFIDSIELSLNLPKIREIADWKHGSVIQENISHDGTYDVYERMIKFWTIKDVVSDYRDYKIERIRKNYSAIVDVDEFLKRFRQNEEGKYSHIFYKLCQAIHFIDNSNSKLKMNNCEASFVKKMTIPEFLNAFDIDKGCSLSEIMCKLPPSVFKWNFVLRHKSDNKGKHSLSSFDQLSSGEKQSILVSNTIIYHLNNLQSIYYGIKKSTERRLAYEYVNIMLDEIELYFHPEFQRTFLKELLNQLDYVDYTGGIKGINIMFITHSPFILSDIPKQNCLFLEKTGVYTQPVRKDNLHTFGGNIYDMLRNSFFIKDSMGSYAKSRIDKIIDDTNEVFNIGFKENELLKEKEKLINRIEEKEANRNIISLIDDSLEPLEEKDMRLINRIEGKIAGYRKSISIIDDLLESLKVEKKRLINQIKEKEAEYRNIISLIDDSLIRSKISQMLDRCLCSSKEYQIRVLKNEMQRIQEEINLIEKEN